MTSRADMFKVRLDAVYPFDSPEVVTAAEAVAEVLSRSGESISPMKLNDIEVDANRLGRAVAKNGRPTFRLSFPKAAARLGRVRNHNHSFLLLDVQVSKDWRTVVAALSRLGPLVSACLFDVEFEYWQNAFDPLQFKAGGRSMDGLPMKSNGLPYPLERQVVDTSRNPGRRVIRQGYVEAIGHRMWLGPEYFSRVPGADRDAIMNADWLQVTELDNGILEVVASDEPFTDDSTADIQNRLRRLLFPTTA